MDEDAEATTRATIEAQLKQMFGEASQYAKSASKTKEQWRKTFRAVLLELERYMEANVDTDASHWGTLQSGLETARNALRCEDFWPGCCAGFAHVAIALLGQFPDQNRRIAGKQRKEHYRLDRKRSVKWMQTPQQRMNTLLLMDDFGAPAPRVSPRQRLLEFRLERGPEAGARDFLQWYRKNHPAEYTLFF